MQPSIKTFQIGQRVRISDGMDIIAREGAQPDGSTGTIVATLTISPGYYAVCLDTTATRCVVFKTNLEALPGSQPYPADGYHYPSRLKCASHPIRHSA